MANYRETSGYEYADSVTGCSCFRWFCCGGEAEGRDHFLLQERGVGPRKEETVFVLAKLKNFTRKVEEYLCHQYMKFTHHNKRRHNQFHYSAETYALNFASELHEQDENGDFPHSFSSRFASRPLIDDQQRRMAAAL